MRRQLRVDIRLYDTHRYRFTALLNSSPNGILDNVKGLSIHTSMTTSSISQKQQYTSILLKLFSALPRDSLSSLHSETLPVHPDVICILLRTQSQLREINIPIEETSPDGLPGGSHIRNSLSQLEKLRLDVIGSKHQTDRDACAWFAQAPKLRNLEIKGRGSEINHFEGWTPAQPCLMKLRHITMRDIRLTNIPKKILEHIDLPWLRLLMLKECSNVTAFLLSFAQRFKTTSKSALATFALLTKVHP